MRSDFHPFCSKLEIELLKDENKKTVEYPRFAISPWNPDAIKHENDQLLKDVSGLANVYAIFINNKNSSKYSLVYIGQTNSKGARTRLTNHLIKKHKKTGAKLKNVIDHMQSGGKIKISWISIDPVSLRHYVEDELIKKYRKTLAWNKHGKQ